MIGTLYAQLQLPENDPTTSIHKGEGEFIYNFLVDNGIKKTLEVGFAYGCSSAYIISATKNKHYVIDAFQQNFFNIGLKNIERFGFRDFLVFENDYSHFALPKLAKEGVKIDFAFIDGGHKFDDIFCDFYFIDLMLNSNGYVLFHDSWMRSTQYVVSWIRNNKKNYCHIKTPCKNLVMVQKTGEDNRPWYDFNGFHTLKSLFTHWYYQMKIMRRRDAGKHP